MRIPLISYKNKILDVQVDICINNVLGAINSKLLRQYCDINEKIKYLGIFIKYWGKKSKIQSKEYMTSYALILLVIYFL
jgi:DNA polymerase sigma